MYKQVKTIEERKQFNSIWERVWKEKGYEFEYFEDAQQFMFQNQQGIFTGSIEIKPYSSYIETLYPFSHHIDISEFTHNIREIDKVSILKESRKKSGLDSMILFLRDYAHLHGVKYYIALIEPSFYLALRMLYRLPFKKLSSKFYYKGDMVIPVIIDAEEVLLQESKYPLFRTVAKFQYALDRI